MSEFLTLAFALLIGILLGVVFFGGLWWTIRKSFAVGQPALWFISSLLLRTSIAVVGFWFVAESVPGGDWRRVLACLVGFLIARMVATQLSPAPINEHSAQTGSDVR